jgi:hypothetical protein
MDKLVRSLLQTCGRTYSAEAGIKLADRPGPLYQLLVLTTLLSTRIRASVAVAAARELFAAGYDTPDRMRDASWQQRVNALGRAHYVRYDESTSTALGEGAELILNQYGGDVRRMRDAAGGDVNKLRQLLQQVPRIGPVGADIFCREAQDVWPQLRPYLDKKTLTGARRLGLPADPKRLAKLVPDSDLARLSASLVHVSLDQDLVKQVKAAA